MNLQLSEGLHHVRVFCVDGRVEHYRFRNISDVDQSIRITWSKVRDTVDVRRFEDGTIEVCEKGTGKKLLSSYSEKTLYVLDGPTHF